MFKPTLRHLPSLCGCRVYSSEAYAALNIAGLNEWISSPKRLVLTDTFHTESLSNLYITLPTRDGTRKPYQPPQSAGPLGFGHHLTFFHPRSPEPFLRADGTDADFSPPEPYIRRMWAGGKCTWNPSNPLVIGGKATATSTVASVNKKGFEKGNPMVFVTQKIDISMDGRKVDPSVVEERSHVYFPEVLDGNIVHRPVREVKDIPISADFSFKFTPSLTTLFRFSALTFNAHHIHLDKDYATKVEAYPERLVHGPLTALMFLEATVFHNPDVQLKSFEYRARNPMIVGRAMSIHGAWKDNSSVKLWCVDEDGVVGMTGTVEVV